MQLSTKKGYSHVLLAGLVISLAACGGGTEGSGSGTGQSPEPVGSAGGEETAVDSAKPNLRALQIWQKEDYNTYPVAKFLEERTGYKVQYDMLPQEKAMDKLNLLMASGDAYDVITTSGGNDYRALYSDYAKKGALVDLDPLLDEFGPNIKAAIAPEALEAMRINGKLFGLPMTSVPFVGSGLMIRQDWLDELGLAVPSTLDELTEVLKQFKERDPGNNGPQNVPLTINGSAPMIDNLVGAFGMPHNWNDVDGELLPRIMDPSYEEYIRYVKELFNLGLLDKEFAVNKDATAKEKFSSGKAGVIPLGWYDIPAIADALAKNQPGAQITYLPALKGPEGEFGYGIGVGFDRITFIPKSSKNPEDAVKWMNAKLEEDTFREMVIGKEGVHYTVEDDQYLPILPIFTDERNQANNYVTGSDDRVYPKYWQARVRKDPRLFEGWEFLNITQPEETRVMDQVGFAPYLPEFSKNNQQLNTMIGDYTVKLIFGAESLDGLEAFRKKYLAAGGEVSIKEVNGWYSSRN